MLALAFTFPGGRYHATPWDRHVNEGAVAWPPDPWRLLRAFIATWHHKLKHSGLHQPFAVRGLIESLAQELPLYTLPVASHSHTRHYMPQWKAGHTSLIFDAFAAIARGEPLYITWPHLHLPADQTALLDQLVAVMGYLGRAESWVEVRRVSNPPQPNCVPGAEALDPTTGELRGEIVTLLAPVPASEYRRLRERFLTDARVVKRLGPTLPESLLEALSVETAELRKQGWSQPPAARKVRYLRPIDSLRPRRRVPSANPPSFTTVRYILVGKPLPRVEDGVRIGELLRMAVMSQARQELGENAIPPAFSGHDLPEVNSHGHAFYLPWDENGDGRIDRLLLHVPAGMGLPERRIVERLHRIWDHEEGAWRLVLESIGDVSVGKPLSGSSSHWHSATPYLHPWHSKKGFKIEDQILRECRERQISEPIKLERVDQIRVGNRTCRPIHFHRFRNKRGLNQPDRHGSFWRLTFAEPITGPLALGFGCHFGLGLFVPTVPPGTNEAGDRND